MAAGVLLAALAVAAIVAGVFVPGGDARTAAPSAAKATTKVTVNATEFKFALSRRSVPTGTVVFKVVNKGKIQHDFKIAGKKTPIIAAGKSATLTVKITKKGRYAFICTLKGHLAAGMKGVLGVAVAAPPPPPPPAPPPPPPGQIGNANTTVGVDMFDYRFGLTQSTIPSGSITFNIVNKGVEPHNFSITTVKTGAIMTTGQSETYTVRLPPRTYEYVCDVPFHIGFGMVGQFTVTP